MMRPLIRREGLHRKGVDFFAHTVAQRGINDLVALHARFSGERAGNDDRLKMRAVALDGEMIANQFVANVCLYCFRGDHGTK